jgi:hypothetical protein
MVLCEDTSDVMENSHPAASSVHVNNDILFLLSVDSSEGEKCYATFTQMTIPA